MVPDFLSYNLRCLADLFFPRFCMGCGNRLRADETQVCPVCASRLFRLRLDWTDNFRLESWFAVLPVSRVVGFTLFKQGGLAATLVHQLKYNGHPDLGVWMGRLAASELLATGAFSGVDLILPIPLSRLRFRHRGYNQAERIAAGISQVTGIPLRNDVLKRVVNRESQTHLNREQRMTNTIDVFRLDRPDAVVGHHVMLIDDVITTGTTMDGAIRLLKDIPQIRISVFAWAWTMD